MRRKSPLERIALLGRAGLEARSCECYGVVKICENGSPDQTGLDGFGHD